MSDAATAPNVLVVDDELQIRRFLRSGFELDGYSVSEAENGREAIRTATLRPTDLIILDLALPDLDGSQVLERIRSDHGSDPKVLVVSALVNASTTPKLEAYGNVQTLAKPFKIKELASRIQSMLAP